MWSKIAKNTLWLVSGEMVGRLLRAAFIIYAARALGVTNWGIFSYALSLAAILTILSDFGTAAILTKELVKQPKRGEEYLAISLILKGLFLLAAAVIALLSFWLVKMEISPLIIIATIILVIADSLRLLLISLMRASEKMNLEAITNIAVQLMITISGIVVIWQKPLVESLMIAYTISSAIGTIISFRLAAIPLRQLTPFLKFNLPLAKRIMTAAWPFAIVGLMTGFNLNIDIIMINWLRTLPEVGYYSAAQKVINLLYIIPALIATASFPSFATLAGKDSLAFDKLLRGTLRVTMAIALPLVVGGIITGTSVIDILFGQEYQPAASTFKILLLTILTNYPAIIVSNALLANNQQREFVKYAAIGVGGNVLFNLLLIPHFGIEGAAFSTVITQTLATTFILYRMKRASDLALPQQITKIVSANLLMGMIVWLMSGLAINFFVILAAAIILYLFLLYLLKEPSLTKLFSFTLAKQ